MNNSPIASLPGFPFFYAIPIDGHIREIPGSEPQIWSEELESLAEEDAFLLLHPPTYEGEDRPPHDGEKSMAKLEWLLGSDDDVDHKKSMAKLDWLLGSESRSNIVSSPISPMLDEPNMRVFSYSPGIEPDNDMITPQTGRARTEPITKRNTLRRKIRYPSLPIGRWAQPSSRDDTPKDISDYGRTIPQTSETMPKRKFRFGSISGRPSWHSVKLSLPSPMAASATLSATPIDRARSVSPPATSTFSSSSSATSSTTSINLPALENRPATSAGLPPVVELPIELEAIEVVSPVSSSNELDSPPVVSARPSKSSLHQRAPSIPEQDFGASLMDLQMTPIANNESQAPSETPTESDTPISELSSEPSSTHQSTPSLPGEDFHPPPELQITAIQPPMNTPHIASQISLPQFIDLSYRSWYREDDAENHTVPSRILSTISASSDVDMDPPPRLSADISPPPHTSIDFTTLPQNQTPNPTNNTHPSNRTNPPTDQFQGDVKESRPTSLESLQARPQSIILMTEEEVNQAEIIEDIFLMLHSLQPGYLHPANRPQPNVVRASMMRRFAARVRLST